MLPQLSVMHIKDFPQYRKLTNNKSWYKIEDPSLMTEIQIMGKFYFIHKLEAKILPERNLIMDLINNEGGPWEEVSEETYNSFLIDCQNKLTLKEF